MRQDREKLVDEILDINKELIDAVLNDDKKVIFKNRNKIAILLQQLLVLTDENNK